MHSTHHNLALAEEFVTTPGGFEELLPEHSHAPLTSPRRSHVAQNDLSSHLSGFVELIANFSEAHTAAIFLLDSEGTHLQVAAYHTLSREFEVDAQIPVGSGLIGWTAENKVRISVCPFENDARTLLCYRANEPLKSFIAVPVLGEGNSLVGVIACDSMKSYAFPKIVEKLLTNCASQLVSLLSVHQELEQQRNRNVCNTSHLDAFLEELRGKSSERELLTLACEAPPSVISRDALVVLSLTENSIGEGTFYGTPAESRVGNRLLDLVCKHKRIICGDRVVQTALADDAQRRSFLSVPFHFLGQEAGSFNVLSRPMGTFHAAEIAALEKVARVVGNELERIRLRERLPSHHEAAGLVSWKTFSLLFRKLLARSEADQTPLALVRISFGNIAEIEKQCGTSGMTVLMQHVFRLLQQARPSGSPACYLYSSQILFAAEPSEARRALQRFTSLLNRMSTDELTGERLNLSGNPAQLLAQGMSIAFAASPKDGRTLEELVIRTMSKCQPASATSPPTTSTESSMQFGWNKEGETRSKRSWGLFSLW